MVCCHFWRQRPNHQSKHLRTDERHRSTVDDKSAVDFNCTEQFSVNRTLLCNANLFPTTSNDFKYYYTGNTDGVCTLVERFPSFKRFPIHSNEFLYRDTHRHRQFLSMQKLSLTPASLSLKAHLLIVEGGLAQTTLHGFIDLLAGDATDLSAACLYSKSPAHCRLAVDLLLRRSSNKSTANLQKIRVMWFELY
jgi:hypothetical protein